MKKTAKRAVALFFTATMLFSLTAVCFGEAVSVPTVQAYSAILTEADNGDVIFEKNADEKLPMASTTKIMTALVTLERGGLTDEVTVPSEAVTVEGTKAYLKEGERISLESLLYALMLDSANDAAVAIAYGIGGSIEGFAELMNERARSLGLEGTHFTNPHGLDDEDHYTTARDLSRLTAEALKNEKFREIVSTVKKTIPLTDGSGQRVMLNHNRLLRSEENVIGVKTGYTERSGRCLVTAAERDGVTVIAVTLRDPDDWRDHRALLRYGLEKYERVTAAKVGEISFKMNCINGEAAEVKCSNREALELVLPKNSELRYRIEADRMYPSPIEAGQRLGVAVFTAEGKTVGELPLYAEGSVAEKEKPGITERILRFFGVN